MKISEEFSTSGYEHSREGQNQLIRDLFEYIKDQLIKDGTEFGPHNAIKHHTVDLVLKNEYLLDVYLNKYHNLRSDGLIVVDEADVPCELSEREAISRLVEKVERRARAISALKDIVVELSDHTILTIDSGRMLKAIYELLPERIRAIGEGELCKFTVEQIEAITEINFHPNIIEQLGAEVLLKLTPEQIDAIRLVTVEQIQAIGLNTLLKFTPDKIRYVGRLSTEKINSIGVERLENLTPVQLVYVGRLSTEKINAIGAERLTMLNDNWFNAFEKLSAAQIEAIKLGESLIFTDDVVKLIQSLSPEQISSINDFTSYNGIISQLYTARHGEATYTF